MRFRAFLYGGETGESGSSLKRAENAQVFYKNKNL